MREKVDMLILSRKDSAASKMEIRSFVKVRDTVHAPEDVWHTLLES